MKIYWAKFTICFIFLYDYNNNALWAVKIISTKGLRIIIGIGGKMNKSEMT